MELAAEDRTARIIWAGHILSYLTRNQSNIRLQGLQRAQAIEDEEEEVLHDDQLDSDAATERMACLSGSQESIRFRFLDCAAQLLSPSKGWEYVTATALREREDFVEIDVARNDCFGPTRGDWSTSVGADSGVVEEEYFRKFEKYMATTGPGNHESQTAVPSSGFESDTVAYTGGRIDHWVGELRRLLHVSSDRRGKKKQPSPQKDAKTWTDFKCLLFQGTTESANFKEKIVDRAYRCVLSADIRQFLLHTKSQAKDGRKIWHVLKCLARPILDCQTLRDIAIRHPQFQNIRICPVRQRHKTTLRDAYRDEHEVEITSTWNKLAPGDSSLSEAKALTVFSEKFKSDCGKSFALHAEMQLFMHYESGAALPPTLDYFGCSKKACLLCESFLGALARPMATRGRHGICYPAWGVPPSTSLGTVTALEELDKMLVSRIKSHLVDSVRVDKRLIVPAVHQSTVASAYSDSETVQGLHRRAEAAESARKAEQKLREMRNIQQGYKAKRLPLDPELRDSQQYASCVMCNHRPANLCNRCRSCYYCSKECQEADWPSHKLLCQKFANQPPRPSPSHKRAILFPADEDKPQMIWVLCERVQGSDDELEYDIARLHPLLGSDNPFIGTSHIDHNPIRGRQLGSGIAFWAPRKAGYEVALRFREAALIDGSRPNRSISASTGMYGTVPHQWCGPVVAMRTTCWELDEDITLADFRHALDYFLSYGTTNTTTTQSSDDSQGRPPTTIRGVMICCYGERKLHGSERYVSVQVPSHHPTRTSGRDVSISPISRRLGMPLRLWKYPDIETWIDPPGWNRTMGAESNPDAAFLMMETDLKSSGWGFAPIYWNNDLGNVLVIREDEEDLSVDDLGAICRFVRKRLLPMFEDAAGFGTAQRTKKEVLEFMTAGNLERFKKETAGCGEDSDSD